MAEAITDGTPVDTSPGQVSFIADELDRLAAAAEALDGVSGQTDKLVMFDSHTATAIAATLRTLLARTTTLQEQTAASEGMELWALRERDALRHAQSDPVAWMIEDLVFKDSAPQFTTRRDRAEGLFGDPKEFRVTPLHRTIEGDKPTPGADCNSRPCENPSESAESRTHARN